MTEQHIEHLLEFLMKILMKIGISALILIGGYLAIKIICYIVERMLNKSKLDEVIYSFVLNFLKVVLWIVILIPSLKYLGVNVNALLTVVGAAGVAVALALQNSLGNFAGGILIILTKPFLKGDYIEDYQTAGKVEKIDLLYTTLITFDNKTITVPNGKLANSTVVNYSRAENRRVDCNFEIGYHDDILKAKEILRFVATSNGKVLKELDIIVGISGHNQNSIGLDLKVWCKTEDYWDVKYFLEEEVKLAFDKAGITIPFPQMDVHLK